MRHYFCDIDGTLTHDGGKAWGEPNLQMIEAVRKLAEEESVVLWSARGRMYAHKFAAKYDIPVDFCLGKPEMIIDDSPIIRPEHLMPHFSPEQFLKYMEKRDENRTR